MPSKVVKGNVELHKALKMLPDALKKKALRKVTRKVAKQEILPLAQRLVPVNEGQLQDSLKVRARKVRRKSTRVGVQVMAGEGLFTGDTFYGGFQEFGWFHWKNGEFIEGNSFLRPALYDDPQGRLRLTQQLMRPELANVAKTVHKDSGGDKIRRKVQSFNDRRALQDLK